MYIFMKLCIKANILVSLSTVHCQQNEWFFSQSMESWTTDNGKILLNYY